MKGMGKKQTQKGKLKVEDGKHPEACGKQKWDVEKNNAQSRKVARLR